MRSQIPQDVAVMLEQSQVYASGVVIEELAQRPLVDQLLDPLDGSGEQEGVIDHDREVLLRRKIDQFLTLGGGACEGLLHKNMLPVFEGTLRQFVVGPDRRHHGDRINLSRADDFRCTCNNLDPGVSFLSAQTRLRAYLRDGPDL